MPTGRVKTWVQEKGFGFIILDGNCAGDSDIFVHKKALVAAEALAPGDLVEFDVVDDGKSRGKLKAVNVEVIAVNESAGSFGGLFKDLPVDLGCRAPSATGVELFLSVAEAGGCSDVGAPDKSLVESFVLKSSLGCPFLVLSESDLVASVQRPSAAEFARLAALAGAYIAGCEKGAATALVLGEGACNEVGIPEVHACMCADFEGEMPGHGGVLCTAQLQLTFAVDGATLQPHASPAGPPTQLGLLLHLQGEPCVALVRRVMESPQIAKLMWGIQGDCESLLYQHLPVALGIRPVAVVDAKFIFNDLGMARMLGHVPPGWLRGLPEKEQIDFDAFHSQNRQALPLPLSAQAAAYAVDDLHRIEAILRSKVPPGGSYVAARKASDTLVAQLEKDPCGLEALKLEERRLEKRSGAGRTVKAVEIARHLLSLRARGVEPGSDGQAIVEHAERVANAELKRAGVTIPADLSFAG